MKIAIFYHITQIGISAFIYQSQIHRLYTSGLIKNADYIHFGVNGNHKLFNVPPNTTVSINKNWEEETDTLLSLKNFCKENSDYKVLYFHMKGVTKECINGESWRLMMEYCVIDRWKECIEHLNDYDVVGSNLRFSEGTLWSNGEITWERSKIQHFVGNFWWSNSSYINQLDEKFLNSNYRFDRELWIGSGKGKMKSLYQPEEHHDPYEHFYKEIEYVS